MQNTVGIMQEMRNKAETQVQTMVEDSTWPCKPNIPVCVMPFSRRQQFENIIGK
jgi:hypothetical protein